MMSPINRDVWGILRRIGEATGLFGYSLFFLLSPCFPSLLPTLPIVFTKDGELFLPVFVTYTEKDLGGVLDTEAACKDSYVRGLYEPYGWAIWPPIPFSYDTIHWELDVAPTPPDSTHLLGTQGGE